MRDERLKLALDALLYYRDLTETIETGPANPHRFSERKLLRALHKCGLVWVGQQGLIYESPIRPFRLDDLEKEIHDGKIQTAADAVRSLTRCLDLTPDQQIGFEVFFELVLCGELDEGDLKLTS